MLPHSDRINHELACKVIFVDETLFNNIHASYAINGASAEER